MIQKTGVKLFGNSLEMYWKGTNQSNGIGREHILKTDILKLVFMRID